MPKQIASREEKLVSGLRDAVAAIDRDRSGMAKALAAIASEVKSRLWITEGRGPYDWDDDRYKEEAGVCLRAVLVLADDALLASGRLADVEYKRARAALETTTEPETADGSVSDSPAPDPSALLGYAALVHGYNALAAASSVLGEKLFYRLLREKAEAEFVKKGGEKFVTSEGAILRLPSRPELPLYETDVEAMRAVVEARDAARGPRGGER